MSDVNQIAEYAGHVKTAFELFRSAVGLVKDVKEVLPDGEKKKAIAESLEKSELAMRVAENEIAKAFGFQLCRCEFPGVVMLGKGIDRFNRQRMECPKCQQTALVQIAAIPGVGRS